MHISIGVNEPSIDEVDRVLHISVGAVDNPGKSVV